MQMQLTSYDVLCLMGKLSFAPSPEVPNFDIVNEVQCPDMQAEGMQLLMQE